MAQKTTVMNVDIDGEDELNHINHIKDARARSNACYNVGKSDISKEIVSMMEINPQIINKCKEDRHLLTLMIL